MPERITTPGPVSSMKENCEAVCIHTTKVYDSCREEDITPLRILDKIRINGILR